MSKNQNGKQQFIFNITENALLVNGSENPKIPYNTDI